MIGPDLLIGAGILAAAAWLFRDWLFVPYEPSAAAIAVPDFSRVALVVFVLFGIFGG